jgi:platelet-activating factor acetylhydrolase
MPSDPGSKFSTMIFSHGLGGTRLAYSHLCGSLASYGMVVIAPEHRDGSTPVTFMKPGSTETELSGPTPVSGEPGIGSSSAASTNGNSRVQVDYTSYPHQISDETANGRNRQLEIRLWELSVIYSALTHLDLGQVPSGTAMFDADTRTRDSLLSAFKEKLDIRTPGSLIWAGHSFGSATMIQMIKSVYYSDKIQAEDQPLFVPDSSVPHNTPGAVPLGQQITAASPLMLLDLWCLPLLSKRTRSLWKQPLPQVGGGNGDRILVIMSDEFFRWRENLRGVRRVLSVDPGKRREGEEHKVFEQFSSEPVKEGEFHPKNDVLTPGPDTENKFVLPMIVPPSPPPFEAKKNGVNLFYVKDSAHLSQSDFGVLFPRAIRKAVDPEMILDLNVRAACEWLRESGFGGQIAGYTANGEQIGDAEAVEEKLEKKQDGERRDKEIFEGSVARWASIPLDD